VQALVVEVEHDGAKTLALLADQILGLHADVVEIERRGVSEHHQPIGAGPREAAGRGPRKGEGSHRDSGAGVSLAAVCRVGVPGPGTRAETSPGAFEAAPPTETIEHVYTGPQGAKAPLQTQPLKPILIGAWVGDEGLDWLARSQCKGTMSFKLNDTQLDLLSAASQHENHYLTPLSGARLAPARKGADKLLDGGFVREVRARKDASIWRRDEETERGFLSS
jgi:hypothetical protein